MFFFYLVPRCPRKRGRDSASTESEHRGPVVCGKCSELFYNLTETSERFRYCDNPINASTWEGGEGGGGKKLINYAIFSKKTLFLF